MSKRKVGVYICHCGGNISDYVDVEKVRSDIEKEYDVVVTRTTMFTCSDASQNQIMEDIREHGLDGIVVASCSPKLHLSTFRSVADRAGLNQFQYVQVNIREQCSWAHSDDSGGATKKAVGLVRGGLEKARLTEPLEPIRVTSVKRLLVIGAGIAGMRAALQAADLGVEVFVVEREPAVGGTTGGLGKMYPSGKSGSETIEELAARMRERENITLFTSSEVVSREGYIGNFIVRVRVGLPEGKAGPGAGDGRIAETTPPLSDEIELNVGAIIVTTGFRPYAPAEGEYGFGSPGVVTLPEFEKMVSAGGDGPLSLDGREIRSIAYIYCVGSRQEKGEGANLYCSRYCCNAAVHASTIAADRSPAAGSYHIYRDIRTYGKFEELYEKASGSGSVFLRFDPGAPPVVERNSGGLVVKVNDLLTEGEEIEIPVDLVVLVTGMVPAENEALTSILRLPLGSDRFYNEIHTKLRPVETVIDGVYIGGCAQGPKNATESVISSLSAVSKAASLLVKGYVDLQPFVAFVREDICEWCGKCESACPYSAISMVEKDGRKIAMVTDVLCKGCGACLPVCPVDATQLKGFTDDQVEGMIDGFAREVVND